VNLHLAFSIPEADMITKDMTIGAIIRSYPQTIEVFARHGLDCNECQIAELESIEHGAGVHKISLDSLLDELNSVIGAS
jgi:hybrid cluster-associated redox disulfide protein